jgi:hypothetical protein
MTGKNIIFLLPEKDKTNIRHIRGFTHVHSTRDNDKHVHILVKFSEKHYGFWQNKGCTNSLAIPITKIIKAFEERNTISEQFLDLRSAYNNVH